MTELSREHRVALRVGGEHAVNGFLTFVSAKKHVHGKRGTNPVNLSKCAFLLKKTGNKNEGFLKSRIVQSVNHLSVWSNLALFLTLYLN